MRGLYKGFGAVLSGIPFASAAYFGGYEAGKHFLQPFVGQGPANSVVAGMLAQMCAGIVYTPMDVVKERLQVQTLLQAAAASRAPGQAAFVAPAYTSAFNAMVTIVRADGPRGLMKGYWAQNFVWWPWNIVYFVLYDSSRVQIAKYSGVPDTSQLSPHSSAMCAAASALAATVATNPGDVVKTRLQTLQSGAGAWVTFTDLLRREGARGLTTGVWARVLSIVPGSFITFYAYEEVKQWLARMDVKGQEALPKPSPSHDQA